MACDINADTKEEITALSFSENTKKAAKIAVLPAWVYGFFSALFTLLTLGGLFLGFLTDSTAIARAVADRPAIYSDSLFGVMVEVLRGSITAPAVRSALPFTLYCLVYLLIAEIVLSISFTILALVMPRNSKKFCLFNGQTVLLVYGALFTLSALYLSNANGAYSALTVDFPSAVVCFVCMTILFFLCCIRNKGRAVTDLSLYLLALLSLFSLLYPATTLSSDIGGLLSGKTKLPVGVAVSLGLLFALIALNVLICVFRLNAGKGYVFDLIRFGLQVAAVVSLIATSFVEDGSYAIFTDQLLPIIVLIASSFAAFCLTAFTISLITKKKHN